MDWEIMKEKVFWKELRELYQEIWNCPKVTDCKYSFPENFYEIKEYCQIPYISKDWSNNIEERSGKKKFPNQLFIGYNPRLGSDENNNQCINVRHYAEEVFSYNASNPITREFDKTHYDYQVSGYDDDQNRHWWGLSENEMWTGETYKFGMKTIFQEVFGNDNKNPHDMAFFNLIPCSGSGTDDTPKKPMFHNCKEMQFLGKLVKILCPDIVWFIGKYVNKMTWRYMDIHWVEKYEYNDWGWVLEYDGNESIGLGLPHPAYRSAFKYLGKEITSHHDLFKIYKEIITDWEKHLDDLPNFLKSRLK